MTIEREIAASGFSLASRVPIEKHSGIINGLLIARNRIARDRIRSVI